MWLYMFWGESFMLTTEPLIRGIKYYIAAWLRILTQI
jgi:hypothetical protein